MQKDKLLMLLDPDSIHHCLRTVDMGAIAKKLSLWSKNYPILMDNKETLLL